MLDDANARVGSTTSQEFGPCEPEDENDNDLRFLSFLQASRLSPASTFFPGGGTRASSRGTHHRIDYICCNSDELETFSVIVVGGDTDLAPGAKADHKLVVATGALVPNNTTKAPQRKPARLHGSRWFNLEGPNMPHLREQFAWKT